MKKPTFRDGQLVRYWHPTKGGWYTAALIKCGRKWATLRSIHIPTKVRRFRVPLDNVRDANQT